MYTTFFGLSEKPFDLQPNPDFLFPSRAHKRALTYLTHGIRERVGFILLTGEVGSGKTTLIRNMIRTHLRDSVLSKVFNTRVDSLQLLMQINADFALETTGKDKAALLKDLNEFLVEQYARRRQSVLIIDEAQNLSAEILEEVRMLSNLETDRDKLLQIILVGQPELQTLLSTPSLLQLRQRIQVNCHLQPLSPAEVLEYILFRLEKAGNREALTFSDDAVEAVARYSRGIPRLINILCDYVLIDCFSTQSRAVSGRLVDDLACDLAFEERYWESAPRPAVIATGDAAAPHHGDNGNGVGWVSINESAASGLMRVVDGQARILTTMALFNKRLLSLENLPVWDHAGLLDLRERLDKIESRHEAVVRDIRASLQQLRSDIALSHEPQLVQERAKPKKNGLWNFLWG